MSLNLFILIVTVVAINCKVAPDGFYELGNYGTRFATRKTYYQKFETTTATAHKATCEEAGLRVLRLASLEESEFLLSTLVNWGGNNRWVGASKKSGEWHWRGNNERINYKFHWYQGYPILNETNCLAINTLGFNNEFACDVQLDFICEWIGS